MLEEQIINYDKLKSNRKKIYNKYVSKLKDINVISFPKTLFKNRDYHLFPIGVHEKYRDKLIEYLLNKNIFVTVNYKSIPELSYYKKKYNTKVKEFPMSNKWSKQTLSLPFHQKLKDKEIYFIVNAIKKFFVK